MKIRAKQIFNLRNILVAVIAYFLGKLAPSGVVSFLVCLVSIILLSIIAAVIEDLIDRRKNKVEER